ncbi:putative neural-cadherin 2 isoform X2 [Cherax quadricarinatus]|uniref:putative neural-cadherin 2 isoform X2 n=1 Tax=Cherax quadricarinatus TaxID=27406 RepID=UPI00387E2C52
MDPGKIFQIITNSTLLATRLLSGAGAGPLEFLEPRYCAVMDEDAQLASPVVAVTATHKQGGEVRYSITGGNKDGLFTIDQRSGLITLAAALDYEIHDKHELVVAAEAAVGGTGVSGGGSGVGGEAVHTIVQVRVADINDNPPVFVHPDPVFTVIEEDDRDLPTTITTVEARDKDAGDQHGLLYTLRGDGVDGYTPADAFFTINPRTGELIQLRALDRDPPRGREVWKVRVQVRDAHAHWMPQEDDLFLYPGLPGDYNQPIPARIHRDADDISEGGPGDTRLEKRDVEYLQDRERFEGSSEERGKQLEDEESSRRLPSMGFTGGQRMPRDKSVQMHFPVLANSKRGRVSDWENYEKLRRRRRNASNQNMRQYKNRNTVFSIPPQPRKKEYKIHRGFTRFPEKRGQEEGRLQSERLHSLYEESGHDTKVHPRGTEGADGRSTHYHFENTVTMTSAELSAIFAQNSSQSSSQDSDGSSKAFESLGKDYSSNPIERGKQRSHPSCSHVSSLNPLREVRSNRDDVYPFTSSPLEPTKAFNSYDLPVNSSERRVMITKTQHVSNGESRRSSLSSWRTTASNSSLRQNLRFPFGFDSATVTSIINPSSIGKSLYSDSSIVETGKGNRDKKLKRIVRKYHKAKSTSVRDAADYARTMDSFPTSGVNNLKFTTKTKPEYSKHTWLSNPGEKFSTSSRSLENASGLKTKLPSFALQKFVHGSQMNLNYEETYRKTFLQRYHKVYGTSSPRSNQLDLAFSSQRIPAVSSSLFLRKGKSQLFTDRLKTNSEMMKGKAREIQDTLTNNSSRGRLFADSLAAMGREFFSESHHRKVSRVARGASASAHLHDHYEMDDFDEGGGDGGGGGGGGCEDVSVFGGEVQNKNATGGESWQSGVEERWGRGRGRVGRVHVVETVVTVMVKDINDNPPIFPNTTMFGEVQENGPIDLSVGVISAWDADDTSEGTNARLTYSIEKNVIHERTGEAIFTVDPQSGLIRTALCCLDREATPEYHIQVVASDGGGLKGTGTVVVRLADVNDNSPRLARQLWELQVEETWGEGPPDNKTILEISAADRDTSNYFFYRVVEASGWGWEHFGMRSVGVMGQLYAIKTLDYENETHRRGFKFMVQVTDRGRGGWSDPRHLDSAWVSVRLRDVNDNPPQFQRPHAHVTVREDTAPGTLLASLPAHDPDMGGTQEVEYHVTGGWDSLTVNSEGGVSLWQALDREAPDGAIGVAKIISVDRGVPPLSATATLTITVTDVNDCPPRLLPPTLLHVAEGGPPTLLGVITATDHDVWALGHGPPFNLSLAPSNPDHVLSHISLTFDSHLDSGRGGAQLWTIKAVDREMHPQLLVGVWAADAQGLSATHTVTVIIDDLNDNPMKPAAKTVYLWKTQGGGLDAPLGRIYVDDPDDWDLADKTFRWVGSPHPLFSLNPDDGTIFASSQVREGRYELQFAVSDRVWGQRGVTANVTVVVKMLTPETLAHAAPVTLTPTTPADLTRGWTPTDGGGHLGKVTEAVRSVVGDAGHTVDVVSVYGYQQQSRQAGPQEAPHAAPPLPPGSQFDAEIDKASELPSTCVWVSVREDTGRFMDPVKLQGLLGLNTRLLEEKTRLTVVVEDAAARSAGGQDPLQELHQQEQQTSLSATLGLNSESEPSSAATRASTALPLQVVDTNVTSLVTPRLTRALACHAYEPESCTPNSCLNGGRCLPSSHGNRCVCPQGSVGNRCKVMARTFSGSGWAWVRPLPPCLPVTVSFRILTRRPHGLLLYSGPLAPQPRRPHTAPTPMLAVQLWEGRPQVLLEGQGGPLKIQVNTTIDDGDWHVIHLHLNTQGVSLMVDLCGRGWEERAHDDTHCVTRAEWTTPRGGRAWVESPPLQVGGLAHTPPRPDDHGWVEAPTVRPLDGCLSHLVLSGQLVDLGEPAYSKGSEGGCHPQEEACPGGSAGCGRRGMCAGGLHHPQCECDPGWSGPSCASPTIPATLGKSSYMKVALSFTPAPRVVTVQLRVRTRGTRSGLLLHLAAHHRAAAFTVHLRAGVACASVSGAGWAARAACVEGRPVGDGAWHTIIAERHGHNLVVRVDDGDGWRCNESLASLLSPARDARSSPAPLEVDKHDGVTVGGMPEFAGVNLVTVHDDLSDSCVDDLRVSGRPLPLPPAVNGTSWGQVTTSERVTHGCPAPDSCLNTTCAPPLSCASTWGRATCSCGSGRQLVGHTCEDVDECLWRPCLHGGTCYNLRPGYLCVCGPGHTGDNCEWGGLASSGHPLTAPAAIAALTLSLLLLVVLGVVFSIRLHRQWQGRALAARQVGRVGGEEEEEGTIIAVKGGIDDSAGTRLKDDGDHDTFLDCLKYNLQPTSLKQDDSTAGPASSTISLMEEAATAAAAGGVPRLAAAATAPEPLPARDDLRAYAYEGDGSSAGSLSSAISGLRVELDEEGNIKPLVSEFLEVMDLLRNLPEATKCSSLLAKLDEKLVLKGSNSSSGCGQKRPPHHPHPPPSTPQTNASSTPCTSTSKPCNKSPTPCNKSSTPCTNTTSTPRTKSPIPCNKSSTPCTSTSSTPYNKSFTPCSKTSSTPFASTSSTPMPKSCLTSTTLSKEPRHTSTRSVTSSRNIEEHSTSC